MFDQIDFDFSRMFGEEGLHCVPQDISRLPVPDHKSFDKEAGGSRDGHGASQ